MTRTEELEELIRILAASEAKLKAERADLVAMLNVAICHIERMNIYAVEHAKTPESELVAMRTVIEAAEGNQ